MLEINTNQLKTRKNVQIDGQGYTVRRIGNIERLNLSQYMRRLEALASQEKTEPLSESQSLEVDDITTRISELFISLFDDGGNQSKSRQLVSSLTDEEIGLLLEKIFEPQESSGGPKIS